MKTPGEVTDVNNRAIHLIEGIRQNLRVLLVSGEPHAGERAWRNLLKSDASVDLVHFTILRPPEKQDGTPINELSLIAFPTRELFVEKIEEFDLIIFDRYRMRGILPMEYIDNVVQYVKNGGTVLVAAGPEFGAVDSLWRSPLAEILPIEPTARVIEEGFRPKVTDLGQRHPVTEGLDRFAPAPAGEDGELIFSGVTAAPGLVIGRAVRLRQAEIDEIRARIEAANGKEVPKVQYAVGEEVKITDGAFTNLTGRIDEIDPDRGKLKISVSIFGRFTPVELEYWQVQRITE